MNRGLRMLLMICFIFLHSPVVAQNFKDQQTRFPRVRQARQEKETALKELFATRKLAYPPKRILIRVFKQERVLELWASDSDAGEFQLVKNYPVCATSGVAGPKRRYGDAQIPEGFYFISGFNPQSQFFLSLRVSYPNQSDHILGERGRLGGDIFVHGNCVTIGCVPITDDGIKELYWLAVEARAARQARIPIHIFPARLDSQGMKELGSVPRDAALWRFWQNLREGFDLFERTRRLQQVTVRADGSYAFAVP